MFIRDGFDEEEGNDEGSATPMLPSRQPKDVILKMVQENPNITRKEMADRLSMTVDGIKYHLKKLSEMGVLKCEGSSRNGFHITTLILIRDCVLLKTLIIFLSTFQ